MSVSHHGPSGYTLAVTHERGVSFHASLAVTSYKDTDFKRVKKLEIGLFSKRGNDFLPNSRMRKDRDQNLRQVQVTTGNISRLEPNRSRVQVSTGLRSAAEDVSFQV